MGPVFDHGATGKQVAVLRGHDNAVWSAAFSPDGARVVTANLQPICENDPPLADALPK